MKRIDFPIEIETQIIAEYNKKEIGMDKIGKIFGCSREVVKRILKENNIQIDTTGQKYKGGKCVSNKRYSQKNKKRLSEYYSKWQKENYERLKNYRSEWRKDNEKNKERARNWHKKRIDSDPFFKLSHNIRTALWTNLKERGYVKYKSTMELLGYSVEELIQHLENKFTPQMNWDNYGEWHVDHIVPLSSINENPTSEDVLELWALNNLQPLWGSTKEIDGVVYEGNLNKGKRVNFE